MCRHAAPPPGAPLALLLLLALPAAAPAQGDSASNALARAVSGPESAARADSLAGVRAARQAQERFEGYRQLHLPRAPGVGGECEVRVGRFCYNQEILDDQPPPEPAGIRSARDTLLAALARAAARAPGDDWIPGQRVRYLVEAGRAGEALTAAAACRSAVPGWCASLAGLALHAAGQIAAADSAFATAAAELPDRERCAWLDLGLLLGGKLRDRYRKIGCEERAALDERLWWLARPFLSRDGNDLRTEHFARVTMARLHERTRTPYQLSWGRDVREILVRYGWPTGWSRELSDHADGRPPRVTGHEASPSYCFLPSARAVDSPAAAEQADWDLGAPLAPARYAPPYARVVTGIEHQWALFRRGDSTLAAAAYDVAARRGRDTTFAAGVAEVALALARDEHTPPVVARVATPATRGTLTATAPWRPTIVGVEAFAAGGRGAARARSGTGVPQVAGADDARRLAISDVLLVEPMGEPPTTLTDALPRARPSLRVRTGQTVGLFWEVYGLAGGTEEVAVTLAVTRERASWGRRGAEVLHLARRPAPVRLRWTARPDDGAGRGVAAGGVTLGFAGLGPGAYRVEVTVRNAAGESARAVRRVTIER